VLANQLDHDQGGKASDAESRERLVLLHVSIGITSRYLRAAVL